MKKIKKVLLMLIACLSLSSCELLYDYLPCLVTGDSNGHYYTYFDGKNSDYEDHEWIIDGNNIKYIIETKATSTTEGLQYKECEICGYKEYETIPKLHSHNFNVLEHDSTSHWYKCDGCDEKENITAHTYTSTIYRDSSCTSKGIRRYTCEVCNYSYDEEIDYKSHSYNTLQYDSNGHYYKCDNCDSKLDSSPHQFVDSVITSNSCTSEGSIRHTCSICGYYYDTVSSKSSHSYNTLKYDSNGHWYKCDNCESKLEIQNHEYEDTTVKKATATTGGIVKHTCKVCGYSYEENTSPNTPSYYVVANYYNGYYKDIVSWTDSTDLINQLHNLISSNGYIALAYGNEVVQAADEDLYKLEYVNPVYTDSLMLKTQTGTGGWDKEHAFCASLMTGTSTGIATSTKGRATDYHNLFAADNTGNRSRSNNNYADISKLSDGVITDRTVNDGLDGYSYITTDYGLDSELTHWEPGDIDKGRLSRALCYMTVMYNSEVYDSNSYNTMKPLSLVEDYVTYTNNCTWANESKSKAASANTAYTAYAHGNASTIYSWANYDVDFIEYKHNEMVYQYQGNRNPFVDYPELIDYCFGSLKDTAGTMNTLEPTYAKLGLSSNIHHYAVKSYKHSVNLGDTFNKSDIVVVGIDGNLNQTTYTDFTIDGISDGDKFSEEKTYTITVHTPINDISIDIECILADTNYKHLLTGGSSGQELASIKNNNGVSNTVSLDGVNWNIYWKNGVVGSTSSKYGVKFGSASVSPETITFTSSSSFTYDGKSNINRIYLEGSTASGCSYTVNFYINNSLVYTDTLDYDAAAADIVDYRLTTPTKGIVKIEITDITSYAYIKYIGVNTVS